MRPSIARAILPSLGVVMLALWIGPAPAEVAEPEAFWTGPMHGEVPATLTGARVVGTDELATLVESGTVVLVDAASPERRPEGLPPDILWTAPPHPVIDGSVWMPGLGAGTIDRAANEFFVAELARLTEYSLDRAIVFYCHPNCWASWNAAKRALSYGYRNVHWYPSGMEGWRDAGKPLAVALPRAPDRQ